MCEVDEVMIKTTTKTDGKVDKIIRYSMQIAMLGQLLAQGLIDVKEYDRVKIGLMKDYGVLSDLTA
jgi:hypothetical protein